MAFEFGIDRLLSDSKLRQRLADKRLAVLAHPASVTKDLVHTIDALRSCGDLRVVAAFGPQHGLRGEKQDNMVESADYLDPQTGIPVHSLYGKVRRPTSEMMKGWDLLLVDLQDVGCRIYTFLTTLFYLMEDLAGSGKEIWILERPNPAGRAVEGHTLDMKFKSFVGAAPLPMRHGLTLGEAALWYKDKMKLDLRLNVIEMSGYSPSDRPWPTVTWVNPSPNIPRISCTKIYPGTVLLEGTNLSEGRGTTLPLEMFGAPGLDISQILSCMQDWAPQWLRGCRLRQAYYEPTFHKFKGELVNAIQVHVDGPLEGQYELQPYRLVTLFLKAVQRVHPTQDLWRKPPYEYEEKLLPIDILSGHGALRKWVADASPKIEEWDKSLSHDEQTWLKESKPYWLYR